MSNNILRNTPEIRGDLDPSQLVFRQMDRCNQLMTEYDTWKFEQAVHGLTDNLPPNKLQAVMERKDEYTDEVEEWEYDYYADMPIGTPEHPINGSPRKVFYEQINPRKLRQVINECWQETGIFWKMDYRNAEYGLYPEEQEFDPPTPVFDLKKNENPEPKLSRNLCWMKYGNSLVKVMNFRGYAIGIGSGEKPWFFNELAARQTKQEPMVLMVTATQGKGKTYCAIRLAEIFDKRFNPDLQIAIDRGEITHLVSGNSKLKRNQAIIIDESQFGANARSWGNKDQQDLMNFLAAARFYGFIIIIVALHRSMLDSIIRERIINYHIHMEDRGHATIYQPNHQRFDEYRYPKRRGTLQLQLPDYDKCSAPTCLTCKHKPECNSIRAIYERKKARVVKEKADDRDKIQKEQAAKKISDSDLLTTFNLHRDKIIITSQNNIDPVSLKLIANEVHGRRLGNRKARDLSKELAILYPELVP